MNSDRTNKLYNYLVEIGAENRSEEVFTNDIYNPERREKLYNYLVGIGAENRPLEAFDNDLGFSQVDTPTNEGPDAILKAPKGGSAYEEFKRNMIPLSVEQKPQVATVLPKYEAEPKEEEAPQTLEQMMGELGGNINKLNKTIEGIENIPQTTMEAWEEMHPTDLGVMNNPISTGDEYIFQNIENGNIGQREYAFLNSTRNNAIARMEAVLDKAKAMRNANPERYEVEARNITDASGVPISGLTTTTNEGALLDTTIRMLEDNIKHYKNAVTKADKVNANKKNGFWKGMGEIDLVNIVSAGWANTLDALKASNIITKANNGGILTPEENLVLDMVKEQGALDEILNAQGGLTRGYKAGQGVAESLPFIAGMATTSGVSGAIKEGIEKGLVTTATKSFRNFAQKAGSKLLGAGASAIATTPLQSGMWNNYANNTINEWKQYGELQDTAWGRLMDGAADAFTDVFTESLGGVLTKSAKYVLPDLGIKASIAKKFGIHDAFLKDMFDKVQWGSAIGEAGEEFLASFLAPIVRGESFKDMKEEWKDAFSKENIWVTLATTGAMSAGFGALRAIEMGSQVATYSNIKNNVANSLSKINDLELKQTVYDAMQLPTLKDTTEALAQINWRNYDKSDIGYAVEYVYNDLQKNVWNGVNLAEDANKAFSTAMVGIQAVARDGVIKTGEMNGEQVYLLGDILEGNDKTPIVVLHMDGRREQVPMSAIKEVGIASVDDVVAEMYSNTIAEAQQANMVDQVAEETQTARAAGVTPAQEQEKSGFEEGDIVLVNGEEAEVTAVDPYTKTARVQVGGKNISVSLDEVQPIKMDEELQMDEQTAEVEGAEAAPNVEQNTSVEEAPVEHSSEQETPTPLQMPMTEKGEPNFKMAGTDRTAQYLTEELAPERIDGFVKVNMDAAQKALQKAEKKQPKSTVFSEYKNEIAQIAEEKKQAQEELAFWQEVNAKLTASQEAVVEETAPVAEAVAEEVAQPEAVEMTPEVAEQEVAPTEPIITEEVNAEEATPNVEVTEQVEVDDIPEMEATTEQTTTEEETPNRLSENEAGLYGEGWENRADAKVFEALAKALGVRIELVDDIDNGLGNGKYFGNTILIRKNDRSKGLKFVAGHEILHRMKTLSPEAFEEFKGVVKETMGEEFDQKAKGLKWQYADLYTKGKVEMLPADATIEEEVVADFVGGLADNRDSDALVQFVERNQEKRTMLQTLRNAFQHILNLFGNNSQRRMAKNIAKNIKAMDALMQLYNTSVQNVASSNVATNESTEEQNDINIDIIEGEKGDVEAITDTAKGQGLFSLRTYEEGGRQALSNFLDQRVANGALTTAEAQEMMAQMDDIYRICNEMKDSYAPFGAWSEAKVVIDSKGNPVFSVIKQNGEYVMNLDFSLVCKKRRTLDAVLNEMVRRGMIEEIPNDNTTIAKINNVIRNYGFETACALCFVDARRFQVLNTAKQFTDLWNTIVRSAVPIGTELGYFDFANGGVSEGVAVELNTDSLTKMSNGRSVAARIAKHLLNNPNDARLLRPRDFVSTAGFDNVKAQNPAIMSLYNSKKGTGGPKAAFSDVQYLNDILNTKWKEEDAFAIGGVRLQSFSDYVPRMVFDYIQMIADLAAKGLPVHAYTKESLFAKTFGLTGMKINLSLVPDVVEGGVAAGLDADGNYVWKQGETFPYEEAIAIQNAEGYKENCGTIAVGVSDAHILKMLDDENIRMVIPYHKSGLPKVVAKMNNVAGFTDYTNAGKEKHKSGKALTKEEAKEIPNFNELLREYNDPRRAAQAFLEWCESKNYTPRFAKFANHPNYYKVLEDFTTLVEGEYVPQEAVKFNFPTEGDAFGSLASLIEQGLEEDAILEGQRDEKVGAIVEEVGEVLDTTRYSLRAMDAPYLEAVERGDMETAQRMVMEAAKLAMPNTKVVDEDGNPKVVYHQTNASVYINRETGQNWDELDWRERMEWDERDDWDDYWEEREFNTFSRVNARTTNEFDGFFFAPEYDEYHEYGDRTIAAFVNIENPASREYYNIDSSKNNAGREERIRLQNEGYDGVIREYDGVVDEYIAFEPNQIKSADPVTYDDNGNVIPLSERFNPNKDDVRYSLKEVNDRFNEELGRLTEDNKDSIILSLGMPSDILRIAGVVNKPMKLYGNKVIKKQKDHGFKLDELRNLPIAVAYPIAVFNNYNRDDNRSVLTELRTKDGNFLVSLNVGKDQDIDFNIVTSMFGKDNDNIINWFKKKYATYIDKEKALNYLHHSALNAEALSNSRQVSETNLSAPIAEALLQEIISANKDNAYISENQEPVEFFSLRGDTDSFKALAEEYNALDKNDAEALADFRARKRNLVEEYWNAMTDELGLPCEFILVDSTIGREALFPIYNVIKPVYEAKFNEPLTFDDFAEEWENDVNYAASYVDGGNIIVGDVVKFDDYNSQDVMTQLFIHENIHHFIDNYITPRELKRLWREVALTSLGRRVIETYPDDDAAKLANEYLAYLIAGVNETDIEPLLDFIRGKNNVSLDDLLSSYGKPLPLRGRYATIILKTLRNGYEEREESRNEEGEEVGENNEPARQVEANNDSRGWLEENLRGGQEEGDVVEFDETPLYSLRTSPEQKLIDENNVITKRLQNAQEVELARRMGKKEQGAVRTIEKKVFNRLADVEKMQEALYEMGVDKSDANNFIARFEAVRNVVDYKNRKEQEKVIVPMLNIVSAINEKYGFAYTDISDYLAAKHSIEREDVSSIQTMSTDANALWNRSECERIVAEFEGKVSKEEVDKLWDCVRAITQSTLSILQAGGVYTKEQIKDIQSHDWQFYVPLQGWDIDAEGLVDPSLLYEAVSRGTSSNGKWQEHSAEGRSTKPQDPLSTIAFKMYKAIYVAEYNKAMNALYYLVSDAVNTLGRDKTDFMFKASEVLYRKTEDGYEEADIESITQEELDFNNELEAKIKKLRKARREAGDKLPEDRRKAINEEIVELEKQRTLVTRSTDTAIPKEVIVPRHIDQARRVYFYVNGRRMYVQFANPKYSQAINGETIIKRTDIDNTIAKYTRFLSQSFTTFNPEFSFVTNPIRDFRDAVLTHLMDAENGNIGGFINNYVFHWGRSQGAIYRAQRGTNNPLTAEELAEYNILNRSDRKKAVREYGKKRVEDTLFMWFAENGGITGYTQSSNIFTLGEKLKKDVAKMQNGDFGVHASAYRALADSAEIITRYATFLASLDKGQSVGQAVSNGRNVSVNFNRKGESSDKIGTYYSFFNASMQGIYKYFRLAKKYPARFGAVVVAQMALGYATSRLVDMLVSTLLPDNDDDDELTTIDIPLWMRLGYTCIPVIRKDGKMHVIRFPKSIAGASFSAVGVLLNELENGRVTRGEALSALGSQIASSWTYGFSEGAPIWRAAIPTGLQPLTDLLTNMDAFGREIYRTDKYNRQIPASELGNKNVIPFIYEATKALNAATGGSEYKSGAVDINPSVVQYILQSVSGGYGVLARKFAEFISPAFSDQVEFEAQNLPMLGRLAYTVEPKSWYNDYAEYEEKYGSARLSNAKKEFKGGYITEDELEDIQKHNVIIKSQDKYINKLLDLRKQFDINTQGYNALSREINRQRGLMVKLMEEIDWSKDNIAEQARRVATKYDPNRKENLLKIRTEYAKEN